LVLREVFLRAAPQSAGYAVAFGLLEIAVALDGLAETIERWGRKGLSEAPAAAAAGEDQ
jgi:hypothetical protein